MGFNAACQHAKERALELKGEYRAISGENWGAVKAETWTAPAGHSPEPGALGLGTLRAELVEIESHIKASTRRQGAWDSERRQREELKRLRAESASVHDLEGLWREAKATLDVLYLEEQRAQKAFDDAQKAQRETEEPHREDPLSCPICHTQLKHSLQGLVLYEAPVAKPRSKKAPGPVTPLGDYSTVLLDTQRKRKAQELEVQRLANAHAKAAGARASIETMEAQLGVREETAGEDLSGELAALERDRSQLAAQVKHAEEAARATEEAARRTEQAGEIHQTIKGWVALAEALSPSGLPQELLAKAISPLQQRLSEETALGDVRLSAGMDISLNHRPHELCSSSEKWCCDAVLAEAIAHLSGIRLLVLDDFDTLDSKYRSAALNWLLALAEEYDTILVLATLKKRPVLPDQVQVVWIESGAVVEPKAEAAA